MQMNKIDIGNWSEFSLGGENGLFDIILPTGDIQAQKTDNGDYPLISSGKNNNGICKYIDKTSESKTIQANTITVDMFGKAFYHDYEFYCVSHGRVNILIPKFNITRNIGLYVTKVIENVTIPKYEFLDMCSQGVLIKERIKLPTNKNGEPDWEYMESYMKNIMQESEKNIENLQNINSNRHTVNSNEWQDFVFGEMFQMQKQKEISPIYAYNKNTQRGEKYPFYGQSSENNGIISYISLEDEKLLNNKENEPIIMIHSNNHLSFYVNSPFYLKDGHGATSLFTNENLNEYNIFFIISILNKTMESKFDYSLKATKEKLNSLKIRLPVDCNKQPDWKYMENYMKNIMQNSKMNIEKMVKLMDGNI